MQNIKAVALATLTALAFLVTMGIESVQANDRSCARWDTRSGYCVQSRYGYGHGRYNLDVYRYRGKHRLGYYRHHGRGGDDNVLVTGLLLGAVVGALIVNSEQSQPTYAVQPQHRSLPRNIVWTGREGISSADKYCREYYFRGTVDGQQQQIYGSVCQQPDGSWKISN